MTKATTTISIDYSRYGRGARITVPLFRRERVLRVGDRVRVVGDDVPERTAVVASLIDHGRKAVLEFDDALAS
jgi:CO dehydrogenase/acetyl-CoA synthase alpha subunit